MRKKEEEVQYTEPGGELLDELIKGSGSLPKLDGLVIGTLTGWSDDGEPLVHFEGSPRGESVTARTTTPLDGAEPGAEVALLFAGGDPQVPVVLGSLAKPRPRNSLDEHVRVELDGERLTLSADKEIVLRVGKASITLTRAGKILIRGAYLLSRSSGVNRIKGGSVQIN